MKFNTFIIVSGLLSCAVSLAGAQNPNKQQLRQFEQQLQQQLGQTQDGGEDLLCKSSKATKTTATTTERILKKARKSKKTPKPPKMITSCDKLNDANLIEGTRYITENSLDCSQGFDDRIMIGTGTKRKEEGDVVHIETYHLCP
jgi:hypothetical protein